MALWTELMVLQTIAGYCFVIANASIGLYNIRDLNNLKGDITFVRAHKWIGRIEMIFFYAIMTQCLLMIALMFPGGFLDSDLYTLEEPVGIHAMFAMFIAFVLVTIKFIVATFRKNTIYSYGQYIGPIGFVGWSIAHWTALYDYYFYYSMTNGISYPFTLPNIWIAGIFPFPIGICIFLGVLVRRGGTRKEKPFAVHQVAFILHGITFGYEGAARELLGTPAILRFVVPKTTEFLEKMFQMVGFDLKKIESMNVNDALTEFAKRAAEIKMAEKVKIRWDSEDTFSVESVNCSTSKVRSVMTEEELTNAVCPWAIMAASIVTRITGKDIEIDPSEFNQIGAKTRLHIVDKS